MRIMTPSESLNASQFKKELEDNITYFDIKSNRFKIRMELFENSFIVKYSLYDDFDHSNELMNISIEKKYEINDFNKPIITLLDRNKILSYDFKVLYEFIFKDFYHLARRKLCKEIKDEAQSFLKDRNNKFYYNIGGINIPELLNFIKINSYNYIYNLPYTYINKMIQINEKLCFIDLKENNDKMVHFKNNSCAVKIIIIDCYSISNFDRFVKDLNSKYRKYVTNDNLFEIIDEFISCLNIRSKNINRYYGNIFLEDYESEIDLWKNIDVEA